MIFQSTARAISVATEMIVINVADQELVLTGDAARILWHDLGEALQSITPDEPPTPEHLG